MKKQIFTLLLSLLLVVSLPFSALADVASGSNAVYGDPFSDRLDTYSSIANVENTLTPKQLNLTFDVFVRSLMNISVLFTRLQLVLMMV